MATSLVVYITGPAPPLLNIVTKRYLILSAFTTVCSRLRQRGHTLKQGTENGPCDGLGGASKRMADDAVKHGKTTIQDAKEFFKWATTESRATTVKYIFMPKENYDDSQAELAKYAEGLITLKGTIKVHCVKGIQANQVLVKETSCFCPSCKNKENLSDMCHGWSKHALKKVPLERNQDEGNGNSERVSTAIVAPTKVTIEESDFVAAVYRFNETTYIGKVVRFDEDDAFVSFMNGSSGQIGTSTSFYWPTNEDKVWVSRQDILCVIPPPAQLPTHSRRSKAKFGLDRKTLITVQDLKLSWDRKH